MQFMFFTDTTLIYFSFYGIVRPHYLVQGSCMSLTGPRHGVLTLFLGLPDLAQSCLESYLQNVFCLALILS